MIEGQLLDEHFILEGLSGKRQVGIIFEEKLVQIGIFASRNEKLRVAIHFDSSRSKLFSAESDDERSFAGETYILLFNFCLLFNV